MNVVVAVNVVAIAIPRNVPVPPQSGAQLQKPWKTSLHSSMMKSETKSIRAIGMALYMYGLTDCSQVLDLISRGFIIILPDVYNDCAAFAR